jgi:hypothetical protein
MRGPVKAYFLRKRPPFWTRQALYMAVFMPVAKTVPPDTTMRTIYEQHPKPPSQGGLGGLASYTKYFVPQNPGILTVQNYVDAVARAAKRKIPAVAGGIAGGTGVAILALAVFLYFKGRGL